MFKHHCTKLHIFSQCTDYRFFSHCWVSTTAFVYVKGESISKLPNSAPLDTRAISTESGSPRVDDGGRRGLIVSSRVAGNLTVAGRYYHPIGQRGRQLRFTARRDPSPTHCGPVCPVAIRSLPTVTNGGDFMAYLRALSVHVLTTIYRPTQTIYGSILSR